MPRLARLLRGGALRHRRHARSVGMCLRCDMRVLPAVTIHSNENAAAGRRLSYLYRAFHALPDLRTAQGEPTGAICGRVDMLRKLRKEYPADYLRLRVRRARQDLPRRHVRRIQGQRAAMPDDLVAQIEPIHEAVRALGWPLLMIEGIEADDVIGTLARAGRGAKACARSSRPATRTWRSSSTPHVTLVNTMIGTRRSTMRAWWRKFGVPPGAHRRLPHAGRRQRRQRAGRRQGRARRPRPSGCSSTARSTAIIAPRRRDRRRGRREPARGARLAADGAQARDGQDRRRPRGAGAAVRGAACRATGRRDSLRELFKRYEFQDAGCASSTRQHGRAGAAPTAALRPARRPRCRERAGCAGRACDYETVTTAAQLDAWLQRIDAAELACIDTETTSLDPMQARLVGISLSVEPRARPATSRSRIATRARPTSSTASAMLARLQALARRAPHTARSARTSSTTGTCSPTTASASPASRTTRCSSPTCSRPPEPRHGRARRAPPRAQDAHLRRGLRQGRRADLLRPGRRSSAPPTMPPRTPRSTLRCIGSSGRRSRATTEAAPHLRDIEMPVAQVLFRMERNGVLIDARAARQQTPRARRADRRHSRRRRTSSPASRSTSAVAQADRRDPVRQAEAAGGQEDRRAARRRPTRKCWRSSPRTIRCRSCCSSTAGCRS